MTIRSEMSLHMFEWSPKQETDAFHSHAHLELGYCISGYGSFHFGDKTYNASPGDIFIVNNLEKHAAASDPAEPSDYYFIFFDPHLLEQFDADLLQPYIYRPDRFINRIPADEPAAREIGSLVKEMWRENTDKQVGYKGVMLGKLVQISGLLLRYYGRQATSKEWLYALDSYYKLRTALDFVKARYQEPITLQDVAEVLHLSPSRTRHFFKERMGEGFKEYVMRIRIGQAKKLLSSTKLPISDIVHECGYQSHAPFYRAFRQFTGMPPALYREQKTKIALFENQEALNVKTSPSSLPIIDVNG